MIKQVKKQDNNRPTIMTTIVGTIFYVFDKKKQRKQRKESKQNNNKVKRLVVRDSPCRNPLSP
jgi:preprotein translocase subunit YajC